MNLSTGNSHMITSAPKVRRSGTFLRSIAKVAYHPHKVEIDGFDSRPPLPECKIPY